MTDTQLLSQASTWRLSAEECRRKDREAFGTVNPLTEASALTLEECALRIERLVEAYPTV